MIRRSGRAVKASPAADKGAYCRGPICASADRNPTAFSMKVGSGSGSLR